MDDALVERLRERYPRHAAQSWEKVGDDWEPGLRNPDGPEAADRIEQLTRDLVEARAQERWQPFTTAPEDGTVILAWREDAGVFTAHYVEEDAHLANYLNPPEGDCYWFTTGGEDLTSDMPTHWRPLPEPPLRSLSDIKGGEG